MPQFTHKEQRYLIRCLNAAVLTATDNAAMALYLIGKIQAEDAVPEPQLVLQPCGAYHTNQAPCVLCQRHRDHV